MILTIPLLLTMQASMMSAWEEKVVPLKKVVKSWKAFWKSKKIWHILRGGPPLPPKHSSLTVTLSVTGTISNSWCSNIDKVLTVQHAEQISSIVSPLLLTVQPCQSFIFYPLSLNLPSGRGVLDSYLKGCYWHCSHVKNKPALSVFAWRIMRVWIRYKQLLLILQPI